MEYLKLPKKRPEYRESRKHSDFLLPLQTRLRSIELLERNIFLELAKLYHLVPVSEKDLLQKWNDLRAENPKFEPRTKWDTLEEYD
jgi:hypothetical protein